MMRRAIPTVLLMGTLLTSTSCSTSRHILVRDEHGQPITDAVVVYREFNKGPFWNRAGAQRTGTDGVAAFSANGLVRAEAVAPDLRWGDVWLADTTAGMIVLTNSPYTGHVIDWYMSKTKDVPTEVRERIWKVKGQKTE